MENRLLTKLIMNALAMAIQQRKPPKGVIHHSDRGSQYCSNAYQALLSKHGFLCSMSGKGNCYDNAVMESFYHTLKVELVYGQRYRTREDAQKAQCSIILRFSTIGNGFTQASITRLQKLLRGLHKLGVQFYKTRSMCFSDHFST